MNIDEVLAKVKAKFPTQPFEKVETKPDPFLKIPVDHIHPVISFLKNELNFESLSDLCGVDYIKESSVAVVYHLFSYTHKSMICLKIYLPREGTPRVRSVVDLYKAANWMERETYDLIGVQFEGHPGLRRILLPEDWEGHPLRKDYVTPDYYNGMPVPLFFEDSKGNEGEHHA